MKQRAEAEHDRIYVSRWHFREKLMLLKSLIGRKEDRGLIDIYGDTANSLHQRINAYWRLIIRGAWWKKCTMLFWYWSLSGFGEFPRRAFLWLCGFVCLPLLVLAPLKLIETGFSLQPDINKISEIIFEYVQCLPLAKASVSSNAGDSIIPAIRALFSYGFQLLIGFQATLFALAVRNRFRR